MSSQIAEIGNVPTSWQVEELRHFLDLITYGFTNPMPDSDEGHWKLTAKDVVGGRINYNTARKTTVEAFTKLTNKSRPKIGDVLLTKDGSIGRVAVVDCDGICINQSVALLRPNERILPEFLKYLLISPYYQRIMEGDSDGSTIKHIYITRVDKMQMAVPPISEQDAILQIVGTLDDRITLLRETNATLEAIAQALFKSWFVDFDPVHAKQQGRLPEGMDEQTAALFPDSFEESELGLVPKGWEVVRCQNIVDVRDGTHESPKQSESGYPLLTSRHITDGNINFTNTYLISDEDFKSISKRSKVDRFDILITMIGTVGVTVGVTVLVLEETTEFAIKNIGLFKTSTKSHVSYYLYLLLKSAKMQNYLESRLAGTTQKYLSLKALREIEVLNPKESVLVKFSEITSPLFEKIYQNNCQIQTLANLRDTLLPRLISGQLRVGDVERT